MIELTLHASEQIQSRGVVTATEVLEAVRRNEDVISQSQSCQVMVIVKTFSGKICLPDGSNGDTVLACVDPRTMRVKTVMLQRSSQVERKRAAGEAEYL